MSDEIDLKDMVENGIESVLYEEGHVVDNIVDFQEFKDNIEREKIRQALIDHADKLDW